VTSTLVVLLGESGGASTRTLVVVASVPVAEGVLTSTLVVAGALGTRTFEDGAGVTGTTTVVSLLSSPLAWSWLCSC